MKVREHKDVIAYLKKRNISKAYIKAKTHIESGNYDLVSLKKRTEKSEHLVLPLYEEIPRIRPID